MNISNWSAFTDYFQNITLPARTLLLKEGEISQNIYFIEKGCMRAWFNNDGKDITFQFFFEGQFIASIESFKDDIPSIFNIESIEPCELKVISKLNFENILLESPSLKKEVEELLFQRLFFYQRLFLSRIKNSPEQRYQELLKEYPEVLLRVPQHYIASYLGITSVSLSRIRNRR
jgi:cyclic nucleotide binding regulatory protein